MGIFRQFRDSFRTATTPNWSQMPPSSFSSVRPFRLRTGPRGAVLPQCLHFLPGQGELVDVFDLFERG